MDAARRYDRAEGAATAQLEEAGYIVANLNHLAPNFPLAALVARKSDQTILDQVRGTTTEPCKSRTPPHQARQFVRLGQALGCPAIYASVHLSLYEVDSSARTYIRTASVQPRPVYWRSASKVSAVDQVDHRSSEGLRPLQVCHVPTVQHE